MRLAYHRQGLVGLVHGGLGDFKAGHLFGYGLLSEVGVAIGETAQALGHAVGEPLRFDLDRGVFDRQNGELGGGLEHLEPGTGADPVEEGVGEVLGVVDEPRVHHVLEEAVYDLAALAGGMDEHCFQRCREVGAGVLHRWLVELTERPEGGVGTQVPVVADALQLFALGEVDQLELLRSLEQGPLQGEHDRNRFRLHAASGSLDVGDQVPGLSLALLVKDLGLAMRSAQTAVHVRTIAPRADPEA
ncbi:hypothetical protein [Streptomyces sp. NPDC005423]|uniref:hypothetical protein n=1 Tax=Streptomyces sp. NPDC005423 TaxID=3155343 RepID=UPI0033B28D93